MTAVAEPTTSAPAGAVPPPRGSRRLGRATLLTAGLLVWLVIISLIHLTQGTADVGPLQVFEVMIGHGAGQDTAVVVASRLPRLCAGLLVGIALGASGATLQGVARNPLASPDTLAVNAGAFLALTTVAAFGVALPLFSSASVAFVGGLIAATVVLALSGGGATSAVRLVLAGSVIALGLASITSVLLLIFSQETQGLFAWGAGSLGQSGLRGVTWMAPVVGVGLLGVLLLGKRLDLLQLGDDSAQALGVKVRTSRAALVVLAVLLAAAAVTVAGPIGFVGLCAPALLRICLRWIPALRRHRFWIVLAALTGAAIVLTADVALRALFGPLEGLEIPTGVVTTLIGAVFLIALAQGLRASGSGDTLATLKAGTRFGLRHPALLLGAVVALLVALVLGALLVGDAQLLLGDVWNWVRDIASARITIILDARAPRILAAALAGASLALAGAVVQAVTRNPLAEPGILGVSSGAGVGAVAMLIMLPAASFLGILGGAMLGALGAAAVVFVLSARGSLDQTRMVLVGIGVSAGTTALTTVLIVRTDPWNQTKAITWLGGSTFGATWWQQLPMIMMIIIAVVVLVGTHRDLDLLQLDEHTPRVLGVPVGASRLVVLLVAVGLTAAATASIGVIAFVGLVAPHAARLLIGRQHRWMLPLSGLLGAVLVLLADTIGRTALAPMQLPAGLATAVVGAPYFVWLLWKMRVRT